MEQLNLKLTLNDNGSITANWSSISDAIRYHAYMHVPGEDHTIYNEPNLMTTTYTSQPNLEANKIYKVVVVAYRPSGENISEGAQQLILSDFYDHIPLEVPANISAVAYPTSVDISFDKVERASSYDILFNGVVHNVVGYVQRISKTISGLKSKTSYTYAVRAKNENQTGAYSSTKTIVTPPLSPAVPSNTTHTSTENSVTVSWPAVSGATGYDVLFNGSTYAVTQTSKTFTGLTANTSYSYQVRSKNSDGGISAYGPVQTVTTAPKAPTSVSVSTNENSITLSWPAVAGATSYDVVFDGKTYRVTTNSLKVSNLSANTSHTYQVRANNANGSGSYGASKTVKTAPQVPNPITKSSTKNSVTVGWDAVSGATSYDLLFNGTTYRETGTSKTISGLTPGTNYSYQVRANNADGSSSYSSSGTASTLPNAPGMPTNVKISAEDEWLTMSWTAAYGATSYEVMVGTIFQEVKGTAVTVIDLTSFTNYACKVRAKNAGGTSAYTDVQTVKTKAKVPVNITAVPLRDSVTLTWDTVRGATGYDVKFNGTVHNVKEPLITITGLKPETNYTYSVCSKYSTAASLYSTERTVKTLPAAPAVPANVTASATANSVTISWSAVSGATGYDVACGQTVYQTTGTSITINNLDSGTEYTYQVRATNAGGGGSYSALKTIKTLLSVPTNVTATAMQTTVKISWNTVNGARSYDVLFNDIVRNIYGSSTTIFNLTPNTKYTYAVRATNYGESSAYSASQTITTLPYAPGVPANVTASATANSVSISWEAVSGATDYEVLFNDQTYATTATRLTISGLSANTSYNYQVRAKNAGGNSSYSARQTIETLELEIDLPVPANISGLPTSNSITLTWSSVTGATGYDIKFGDKVYSTSRTSITISGLPADTYYNYQVRAKNSVGTGPYSAVLRVSTYPIPPAVPTNVRASVTANSITVSWDSVSGASYYHVHLGNKYYDTSDTEKTITGLEPGTNYNYSVAASNLGGISKYSEDQTATTLLGVPTGVSAASTLNTVTVSWDAMDKADSYDVQFDGKNTSVQADASENTQMHVFSRDARQGIYRISKVFYGLKPNTEHTYCVRANNAVGSGEYSPLQTIKTQISKWSGLPGVVSPKTYPDGKIPHMGLEPVNALTGAFLWSYTLLKDYGKDNLHFTIMYDSQRDESVTVLGKGWTHSFNYLLYKDEEYVYFSTPYDEVVPFRIDLENNCYQQEEMQESYTLSRKDDGFYVVQAADGMEYVFDENLHFSSIVEGGSTVFRFTADEKGQIIRIEGRQGRMFTLTYQNGHIAGVSDALNNRIGFTYETNHLTALTNPAGSSIRFTYDDVDRLLEVKDFSGESYLTNWYDMYGRVIAQSIAGRGESFASYDTVNRITTFTDELGNETKYHYNANMQVTRVEYGESGIENNYNEKGQLIVQVDALNHTTQMLYDECGRMNCVVYPDGTREEITYNSKNYPVKVVNRDGTESIYGYDEENNLISAQDERGNVCSYTYDENHNLTSYTDKEGNVWSYVYDEENHLQQAQDPEGNIYQYTHDSIGRMTSYTTPTGRTTSYQYSAAGDLLGIVDEEGSVLFAYDSNGSRTGITDKMGNQQRLEYNEMGQISLATDFMGKEYRFAYDQKGNLITVTDPVGYSVHYTYDAMGNKTSQTDQNGNTTRYFFDAANQLTEIRDAQDGAVKYTYDTMGQVKTVTDPMERQTSYAYDPAGRIVSVTDAMKQSVSYTYDQMGNLLTKTDEDGAVTEYTYDKENRLLSIQTDTGTTSFTYDKLGRIIAVLDAENHTKQAQYDGEDNLTSFTDEEGNQTTYTYDSMGLLSEKTAPDGGKTAYVYDKNGNCTLVTDAEGNEYAYAYNANNQLVKTTDPLGQETTYVYDDRGQLISVTDAKGGTTSFVYDGNGNLIGRVNPLGGEATYVYDSLNRLVSATDEEGNQCTYTYDAVGNMISYTDANGNRWVYTYNALNRLVHVINQDDDRLTYSYTNTGRIAKITDQEGAETSYQYDAAGRLTQMSDALGHSLSFTYDALGRVLTQTDANGNTTEYGYSPAGNLLSIKDPEGGMTAYTYNAAGQVLTETDPMGNVISYEYDALGQAISVTNAMGDKLTFTYTPTGRIASVTNPEGGITNYTYDACGNLIQTIDALGNTINYEYDAMNNQIKEYLSDSENQIAATLYQYDQKGRIIKEINPLLEERTYTYDGNGNIITIRDEEAGETTVRYDLNNRPVRMGYSDGKEALFRYNKRGELVELTDWNGTATVEHDLLGRVVKVTDHEGRSASYGYDAAGGLASITYPDGSTVAYGYDGNNRLTTVTEGEEETARYSYDPAGRLLSLKQPGSTAVYGYNACGLPVSVKYQMEDGTSMEETLSYDTMGRITASLREGSSPAHTRRAEYAYDSMGRLLSLKEGSTTESYGYDALGNRILKQLDGIEKATYEYNALNQLVKRVEDGVQYSYGYDRRGNLIQEHRGEVQTRQYTYDATNHMTLGKNLENGTQTEYTYNALYMRIRNLQTLAGADGSYTRDVSYLPDFLSRTGNELMTYEKGKYNVRTVFGRGYERLAGKVTMETDAVVTGVEMTRPEAAVDAVMEKAYFQPDLYGSALFASNGQGQVLRYAERGIWGDLKLPVDGDLNAAGLEENLRFTSYGYDSVIGKHFAKARFYDSSAGRMLAKDPVKRGLNGYGYCDSDPVNYTDPTGEVANIIAGGVIGAVTGGIFGFGGSALSQIFSGEDFSFKKALGAGVNGAIVGGVHGALIGSGVGIGVSLAADFGAGALGSTAEQLIGTGRASAKESIKDGLINAVTGRIYGTGELKSAKSAFLRGFAAGGATSGINYLSDALTPRAGRLGRSSASRLTGTMLMGAASAIGRDPRRGCETGVRDNDWMGTPTAYGYQYGVTQAGQEKSEYSVGGFFKETLIGAVTGGLASTAFYGAGKAIQALTGSIRSNKGSSRTDFYVTPSGDVVPSTGYRYMSSSNASDALNTGKQYTTYIGFDKFDSALQARDAFQVSPNWSDCKVRGTFDTLQVIDDMYVPTTLGNTTSIPEPFAISYPEYGNGGIQQFRVDKVVNFLEVEIIGD
ncbi:MAG: hypothetical protein HDQ97_02075 [Lachnospiraceae bacterium]|nr:hypothetical protein [Lachnospiraceae bacterium]